MSDEVLISVDNVSKKFCRTLKRSLWYGLQDVFRDATGSTLASETLRPGEFWATNDVSFELKRGECLGLVGRNGAGKTTLLRMLNGLIKPDLGRIHMRGRAGALIALGAGFNPILTGRENIYVNGAVLGLKKREIDAKLDEIIDFSGIEKFIDSPVQSYSSGMQVRLGFSIATAMEPDILLLDEVLAVGDTAFRSKCMERIGKILDRAAVIFVSHDDIQVSRICDQCLYLLNGTPVTLGQTEEVLDIYRRQSLDETGVSSLVLDDSITRFGCFPHDLDVSWGGAAVIKLEIESSSGFKTGLALLTLLQGEVPVLQSDITELVNVSLTRGAECELTLGPLYIRKGEYSVAITILSESKKSTLVHAINCATISVDAPVGYGVVSQLPSRLIENS